MEKLNKVVNQLADIAVRKNRAEGSILGAFIADSIGSALEFRKVCTEEDVKMAMRMPGNVEPWFLEAGQVTDDSELAMCQLHAFSQMEQGRYQPILLADYYGLWFMSNPADIGNTTFNGLQTLRKKNIPREKLVEAVRQNVFNMNMKSQSNGSLMRCTPLAVYSHLLPSDQLRQTVIKDNNFTHCNPNVIDAVYLYCFTIGKLISSDKSDMKERIEEAINLTSEVCMAECNEDVKQWFDLSRHFAKEGQVLKSLLDPSTNIGFLKHAFVLSYFFLQSLPEKSYAQCIAETMSFAGDTDTNGAIVGGMIGACFGRSELPQEYIDKVLKCGPKQGNSGIMPVEVQPACTYQKAFDQMFSRISPTVLFDQE